MAFFKLSYLVYDYFDSEGGWHATELGSGSSLF